jgi:hypothetical protein
MAWRRRRARQPTLRNDWDAQSMARAEEGRYLRRRARTDERERARRHRHHPVAKVA